MKLRTQDPWMTGVDYSRGLHGFTVNLLVSDVARAAGFAQRVLGATVVFSDVDFAVVRYGGQEWMLHADHTYDRHPHGARTFEGGARGLGVELRIHDRDPDAAAAAAQALGCVVVSEPQDKGHGMREVYILDPDGYTWVVDTFIG